VTRPSRAPGPRPAPRYGRIAAFVGAVISTLVTVSAGVGLLPSGGSAAQAAPDPGDRATLSAYDEGPTGSRQATPPAALSGHAAAVASAAAEAGTRVLAPPADSGEGRRVVFDLGQQRVWLLGRDGAVRRTYLVSGSASDNLAPGTYEVYSRSRHATGIDGSSMDFMVRFTTGDNAAIGFHDIPEMNGEPVQTRKQLGTPLSHGCVRQARPDAVALWRFASIGTTVVVTA
jgi:hypothetical protein